MMKLELYNYDIYPKVFPCGRTQMVTVQPLGGHVAVLPGMVCQVEIKKMDRDNWQQYPEISGRQLMAVPVSEDGCLHFTAHYDAEGEYLIQIWLEQMPDRKISLSVYALEEDLAIRLPFRGDLHVHTCRSDAQEAPATVAANYRGHGYDFMAITDHRRYYPSLEAMAAWEDLSDLILVPGEEVHLPFNDVHYVNFGGSYSINALVAPNCNQEAGGDDLRYRSLDCLAPAVMDMEEFETMIRKRAENVPLEHESLRLSYAVLQWTYEQVQKGDGLGIFPHPCWVCPVMQVPEMYTRFIYENAPFDAFEVLGGESYYAQNGFQTGFYYEMKAKGFDRAVVGSTDTHGSTEHNPNAKLCSTIVFAKENSRGRLIDAIKEKYSIAVDTNNCEYRLVGDYRLMKYASFLMENYFPLHDQACRAEGYYMNRCLAGDPYAKTILLAMKGQIQRMQEKYFAG